MSELTKKIRKNLKRYPSDDPQDFTNVDEIMALVDEIETLEKRVVNRKVEVPLKEGIGLMTVTVQIRDQEWAVNNYYEPDGGDGFKQCFRAIEEAFDRLNQKYGQK